VLRTLTPAALALALLAGCADDPVTQPIPEFPVAVNVTNNLIAPVSVAIDGKFLLTLPFGATVPLTVSSHSQWLTWSSAKPMDEHGIPIPDDIGDVDVSISGIRGELDINNVIQDRTYVTARIYNNTTSAVSIGVFDGTNLSCASRLPASSASARRFTQIGYYRLLVQTELRAYRGPADCTGPFVAWPAAALRAFDAKTGLLMLTLDSAP
jgi:hypothetical protein